MTACFYEQTKKFHPQRVWALANIAFSAYIPKWRSVSDEIVWHFKCVSIFNYKFNILMKINATKYSFVEKT